jgi:recombination protein RecR
MKFPKSLEDLIENFKLLPGIGEKNAERLSFAVLKFNEDQIKNFSESIINVSTKIKKCTKCNNLTEDSDLCTICSDDSRDSSVLCVVESTKDLILFEKSNAFKGKYHVLEGLISPLEGVNPDDIKINELIKRIKDEKIKEVILALNLSMEGETTSLYIIKMLEGMDVSISKIAAGIPVGADMDYLDSLTIQKALEGRVKVD